MIVFELSPGLLPRLSPEDLGYDTPQIGGVFTAWIVISEDIVPLLYLVGYAGMYLEDHQILVPHPDPGLSAVLGRDYVVSVAGINPLHDSDVINQGICLLRSSDMIYYP